MNAKILTSALFSLLLSGSAFALTKPTDDKLTAEEATVQVSTYKTFDNHLRVNVVKSAPVRAAILFKDADGRVIHSQYLTRREASVATKFDLSNLEDGTYKLEVVSQKTVVRKEINLRTPHEPSKRLLAVK